MSAKPCRGGHNYPMTGVIEYDEDDTQGWRSRSGGVSASDISFTIAANPMSDTMQLLMSDEDTEDTDAQGTEG